MEATAAGIGSGRLLSPDAFDDAGDYRNEAETLFRKIGAEVAPEDAPPMPPTR